MNIGIDIDDTLTDLFRTKIKTAKKFIKENNYNYKVVDKTQIYLSGIFNWGAEVSKKFWQEEGSKMLSNISPRKYVREIIQKLKNDNHSIFIITARTTDMHKDPYAISEAWLKKNGIFFDKLLVGKEEKAQACLDENIDVFIDDLPKHVLDVNNNGRTTAILMQTIANKNLKLDCLRVKNWKQIYKIIKNMEEEK